MWIRWASPSQSTMLAPNLNRARISSKMWITMTRSLAPSSIWRPLDILWAPICIRLWLIKWISLVISRPNQGRSKMIRTIDRRQIQIWKTIAWRAVDMGHCIRKLIRKAPWFRCVKWIRWARRRKLRVRTRPLIWRRRVRVGCKCTIASLAVAELFIHKQATRPGSIMAIILAKPALTKCDIRVTLKCNNQKY